MAKKKKKLGPHKPKKNKPAQTRAQQNTGFSGKPAVTNFTINQPKKVNIKMFFINGGRAPSLVKVGHKGGLRRGGG